MRGHRAGEGSQSWGRGQETWGNSESWGSESGGGQESSGGQRAGGGAGGLSLHERPRPSQGMKRGRSGGDALLSCGATDGRTPTCPPWPGPLLLTLVALCTGDWMW